MNKTTGIQIIHHADTGNVEVRTGFLEHEKTMDMLVQGLSVMIKNELEGCEDDECTKAVLNRVYDRLFFYLDEIKDTTIIINDK